jgi:hypothetical protein
MALSQVFRQMTSDVFDPVAFGREWLDFWSAEMATYLDERDALGRDAHVVDVSYADIVKDPISIIHGIYAAYGRELTDEHRVQLQQWELEHRQYRFGTYSYSLEQFGLTDMDVDRAFAGYRQRFEHLLATGT